jgi:hypothetical protein
MDASRFDRIVRTWAEAGSRRPILGLLAGGVAGLAGLTGAAGKRKKKKKKVTLCLKGQTITVPKKKQGSYLSQGATAGKCPATCVKQCTGKTCGPDGCGGSCGSCQGDLTCQGGTCACPAGETECAPGVCAPLIAQCCTDDNCQGVGQRCLHGSCVAWQGTCPVGADTCVSPQGCNGNPDCLCFQSTEGETRCGSRLFREFECERCTTSDDCKEQLPDIPGVFCKQDEQAGCGCPGVCLQPCPSA